MSARHAKRCLLNSAAALALTWGVYGTPAMADSFVIPDGTTETTQQVLDNGDTGVIDEGGTLSITDDSTAAIIGALNDNEITNNGTLITNATVARGIEVTDGNTITNNGNFVTSGPSSSGIIMGSNNVVTNTGTIVLNDDTSTVAIGGSDNNTVINSGSITTGGLGPPSITLGDGNTIEISGSIDSAGAAIFASDNNTLAISGTISGSGVGPPVVFLNDNNVIDFSGTLTSGDRGGIFFDDNNTADISGSLSGGGFGSAAITGDENNTVTFSGSIETAQDGGFGINISDNNTLDVSGTIETQSDSSDAILLGENNTVDVSGSLSTSGIDSNGILGNNDNTITVSGSIRTTGQDADGIDLNDFNRITNTGVIKATGTGSADAIEVDDNNVIVNTGILMASGDALANGIDGESNNNIFNSGTVMSAQGAGIDFTAGSSGSFVFNNGFIGGNGVSIDFGPGDNDSLSVANGSILDGVVDFDTGTSSIFVETGNHTITSTGTTPTITSAADIFFVQDGDTVTSLDQDLLGISELNHAFLDQSHRIHRTLSNQVAIDPLAQMAANAGEIQVASNDDSAYGGGSRSKAFWASFYGGFADRDDDGQIPDSNHTYWGGLAGARLMQHGSASLGLFAGYGNSRIDSNDDRTTAEVDRFFGGAYGALPLGQWSITANIFGGAAQTDSVRNISNNTSPGGLDAARGDIDSLFVGVGIETARVFNEALGTFGLKPAGGIRYAGEWSDGYTETGAFAALTVDDRTAHAVTGFAELALVATQEHLQVEFGLGAEGRALFGDDATDVTLLATPFTVTPEDEDNSIDGYVRLGLKRTMTNRLSLFLDLEGRTGSDVDVGASAQTGLNLLF